VQINPVKNWAASTQIQPFPNRTNHRELWPLRRGGAPLAGGTWLFSERNRIRAGRSTPPGSVGGRLCWATTVSMSESPYNPVAAALANAIARACGGHSTSGRPAGYVTRNRLTR
jgi:hypothetical protein